MIMRSKLFIPATRPELFAKAEASAADALSFDLEDAVAEERKDEARAILTQYLRTPRTGSGKVMVVRVNAAGTRHFEADVEAVTAAGLDIINLPMAEEADAVALLADRIGKHAPAGAQPPRILVNIETPLGLRRAAALAGAHPSVMGLQVGYADLLERYGMDRRDEGILSHIRTSVRLAAAEAGVAAYDGAFAAVKDTDGYRQDCLGARRHGFAGKSCIHPTHIVIANEVFMPTAAEVARARKIVAAAAGQQGVGAFLVDGDMIDKPFLERATAIVALADSLAS